MTNVLIKKKKKRRKHRHIEKKAIWSWKQRLEFCIYKPRNVNNSGRHQKLGINSPLEPQEGINTSATLILDFWTTEMESQTWAWLSLLFLTLIVDGISKNLCCCHPLAPRIVIIYYILYIILYMVYWKCSSEILFLRTLRNPHILNIPNSEIKLSTFISTPLSQGMRVLLLKISEIMWYS